MWDDMVVIDVCSILGCCYSFCHNLKELHMCTALVDISRSDISVKFPQIMYTYRAGRQRSCGLKQCTWVVIRKKKVRCLLYHQVSLVDVSNFAILVFLLGLWIFKLVGNKYLTLKSTLKSSDNCNTTILFSCWQEARSIFAWDHLRFCSLRTELD